MEAGARRGRARAAVLPFPHAPSLPRLGGRDLLPSGRALLIGFAIVGATVGAYFVARETSMFAVRTIEIDGAPPAVAAHVRSALRSLDGKSLLALNGGDVTQRLDRLPDVASVSYDRNFPHTLRLHVVPAHTLAMLRRGASAWLVSSDGRVIRSAGRTAGPLRPRIWLPSDAQVNAGDAVPGGDASNAISALAGARRAGFAERVLAVRANDHELTFILQNHLELRFGNASDLVAKVAVARKVVPLSSDFGYLDVSVPERPVAGSKPQLSG
jgi:cell division protein FtsQ